MLSSAMYYLKSIIQRRAICYSYKNITIYLHDESSSISHSSAATVMLLSDTTIVLITEFNNLPENRKYLASASVYYSEQTTQHSSQLITSEYYLSYHIDNRHYSSFHFQVHLTFRM